jgi:DNA primase
VTRQEISRPDKILYPDPGFTKADLAEYYENVAEWMLPFLETCQDIPGVATSRGRRWLRV